MHNISQLKKIFFSFILIGFFIGNVVNSAYSTSTQAATSSPVLIANELKHFCQYQAPNPDKTVTITFHNNCDKPFSVAMMGRAGKGVPYCLHEIPVHQSGTVYVNSGNPAFYQASPGADSAFGTGKTRFEPIIEIDKQQNKISKVWYNISANMGWDVGMTIKSPSFTIVARKPTSPATYAIPNSNNKMPKDPNNKCAVQPCKSPVYFDKPGSYDIYLCNNPTDQDTKGPCGTKQCPGIPCFYSPTDKTCTTSGSHIYCRQGGTDCPYYK